MRYYNLIEAAKASLNGTVVMKLPSNAFISEVHITDIRVGDTVLYRGELKTVCQNNIRKDDILGVMLWGDSFRAGIIPVQKVTFR